MPETQAITDPTTVRHRVGECPGCHFSVYAEVQLVTVVHPPRLNREGRPDDCAHAVVVGSRVEHNCAREVDGEWATEEAKR